MHKNSLSLWHTQKSQFEFRMDIGCLSIFSPFSTRHFRTLNWKLFMRERILCQILNAFLLLPKYRYFYSRGFLSPVLFVPHIQNNDNNHHFNLNVVARLFVNAKRGVNGVKIVSLAKKKKGEYGVSKRVVWKIGRKMNVVVEGRRRKQKDTHI